jgi:membrane glycosyltransferase
MALAAGAVVETLFSVLLAPIMMLLHARFVMEIVSGRSVQWGRQDRDATALSWRRSLALGAAPTAIGLLWGGATLGVSPAFFLWMSPIFVGLILAIPLVRWTSSAGLGQWAWSRGLLRVPEECRAPPELTAVEVALQGPSPDPSTRSGVVLAPASPVPSP